MNQLDRMFEENSSPGQFAKRYSLYLAQLLERLDYEAVEKMIDAFLQAREKGKIIFFIGNGGSAATASHFSNDISIGTRTEIRPFKTISLTDNNSIITAIGNDDGYDKIFVKQLKNLLSEGDILVAISASGNSPNIIEAVNYAKEKGNQVIGLTGFDGGKLRALSDIKVHVDTAHGEYGPVEDIHMVLDHLIGSYLYRAIRSRNQPL